MHRLRIRVSSCKASTESDEAVDLCHTFVHSDFEGKPGRENVKLYLESMRACHAAVFPGGAGIHDEAELAFLPTEPPCAKNPDSHHNALL